MKKVNLFFIIISLFTGAVFLINNLSFGDYSASLSPDKKDNHYRLGQQKDEPSQKTTKEVEEKKIRDKESEAVGEDASCLHEINSLSIEELKRIDGVGQVYAERISKMKSIENMEDLQSVDGIGEVTSKNIKEFICNPGSDLKKDEEEVSKSNDKRKATKADKEEEISLTEEELKRMMMIIKNYEEINGRRSSNEDREREDDSNRKEVNINKADKDRLQKLSGIGPAYAERIIENRPFCRADELTEVKGIGEITLENIKEQGLIVIDCNDEDQVKSSDEDSASSDEDLQSKIEKKERDIQVLGSRVDELRDDFRKAERSKRKLEEELEEARNSRDRCTFSQQININKAEKEELTEVKNVGSKTAEEIIGFRDNSPIEHIEELKKISGIGESIIDNFIKAGYCTHGDIDDNNGDDGEDGSDGGDSNDSIEINKAEKERLTKIHGVGDSTADNIINYRKEDCFFHLSDLTDISGIGETTLEEIEKEGLAYTDPSPDCFENELTVFHPEEVIRQSFELSLEFSNFKDSEYDLKIKMDDEKRILSEIELDQGDNEMDFEMEANKKGTLSLGVVVTHDGEVVVEKESEVKIIEPEEYEISFIEKNGLEGVEIKIYDLEGDPVGGKLTDQDGSANKKLISGSYNYTISKEGYQIIQGQLDVEKEDKEKTFELVKIFEVEFKELKGVGNAEIAVYGDPDFNNQVKNNLTTDSNGVVAGKLKEEEYWFKASLQEYKNYEGSFCLDKDKTVEFEMDKIENMLKNPSFESEGESDEDAIYWNQKTSIRTNSKSKDGDWSMMQKDINANYSRSIESEEVEISSGVKYEFGGYYYLPETNDDSDDYTHLLRVHWLDHDGKEVGNNPYSGSDFKSFNQWTEVSHKFKAPENATRAKLKLRSRYDENDPNDIYWDKLFLKEVTS